jgi:hypothetical protein
MLLKITNDTIKKRDVNIKELFADINIDNEFDENFNLVYKVPILSDSGGNLSE